MGENKVPSQKPKDTDTNEPALPMKQVTVRSQSGAYKNYANGGIERNYDLDE